LRTAILVVVVLKTLAACHTPVESGKSLANAVQIFSSALSVPHLIMGQEASAFMIFKSNIKRTE
jgi:hypothetical protein